MRIPYIKQAGTRQAVVIVGIYTLQDWPNHLVLIHAITISMTYRVREKKALFTPVEVVIG